MEPSDTDALQVEEDQDLVTLLTCTPYGVNSHRLLVRGHRVEYVPEVVEEETVPFAQQSLHTNYLLWVVVWIAVTGGFILILFLNERKVKERLKAERKEPSKE